MRASLSLIEACLAIDIKKAAKAACIQAAGGGRSASCGSSPPLKPRRTDRDEEEDGNAPREGPGKHGGDGGTGSEPAGPSAGRRQACLITLHVTWPICLSRVSSEGYSQHVIINSTFVSLKPFDDIPNSFGNLSTSDALHSVL